MSFFKKDGKKKSKSKAQQNSPSLPNQPPTLAKLPTSPGFEIPTSQIPPIPQNTEQIQAPQNTEQIQTIEQMQTIPEPPQLPRFPNSQMGDQMNQSTIKEAVQPNSVPELPTQETEIISQPVPPQIPQAHQGNFTRESQEPTTMELSKFVPSTTPVPNQLPPQIQKPKTEGPLFIQLDKFEKTISTFDEIKLKISEIESLLRSIRDVKSKEDEKLNHWEHEIESIKSRLDAIDQNIFNKI
ncbi:MAG: hypothetical protein U9Q06_00405 [Nanoarchaeota archaeon]|nr:hypothetical protein [Nanoarchaeota archaeon]